jgi:hypothetical protein
MASLSVPPLYGWGNWPVPCQALLDWLPGMGEVRGCLFLCGRGIERIADHRRQRGRPSPALPHSAPGDFPGSHRFLGRPRLLTRT